MSEARSLSRIVGVVLLVLLIGSSARAQRPNIIFIMSDDHATQAVSAYGSVINRTPNIDRIAAEGAIALNAFCGNSICAPSRATILTGVHSHVHGLKTNRDRLDESLVTFPVLLRGAGYATALFGKWHLKTDPRGFDTWAIYPDQGEYYNPDYKTPSGTVRRTGYCVDLTTRQALDWLTSGRDADKPFLLLLQYKAPHRNWMPGPEYLHLYEDQVIPEPPTLFARLEGLNSGVRTQEMEIARHMFMGHDLKYGVGADEPDPERWWRGQLARMTPVQRRAWDQAYGPRNAAFDQAGLEGADLTRWKYQRFIKDYLRCVAAVDDGVGRILEFLDANGLADSTVVIYTSDQGFFLGENGWFDKRWMYEESLRIPLVVRWPGEAPPGTRIGELVQNIDIAPTLLELADVDVPMTMQGHSLVPRLRGEHPSEWRDAIYYRYYQTGVWHNVPKHRGIRTDRYKLIYYDDLGEWELFDLAEDPDEQVNLFGSAEHAAIAASLRDRLVALARWYEDDGAVPEIQR
jgi:arylsulfatase A-like enzyme